MPTVMKTINDDDYEELIKDKPSQNILSENMKNKDFSEMIKERDNNASKITNDFKLDFSDFDDDKDDYHKLLKIKDYFIIGINGTIDENMQLVKNTPIKKSFYCCTGIYSDTDDKVLDVYDLKDDNQDYHHIETISEETEKFFVNTPLSSIKTKDGEEIKEVHITKIETDKITIKYDITGEDKKINYSNITEMNKKELDEYGGKRKTKKNNKKNHKKSKTAKKKAKKSAKKTKRHR
jgi:hypothetical protein